MMEFVEWESTLSVKPTEKQPEKSMIYTHALLPNSLRKVQLESNSTVPVKKNKQKKSKKLKTHWIL